MFAYLQNGLIRSGHDDYLIEPIQDATMHEASGFVGQPHKLYKRSVLEANQHTDTRHRNHQLRKIQKNEGNQEQIILVILSLTLVSSIFKVKLRQSRLIIFSDFLFM